MTAYVDTSVLLRLVLREPGALDGLQSFDAIHLATALVWRERTNTPVVMTTHDAALALGARAFGFEVQGA